MHAALADALVQAAAPEIRAVVITGAGRGFCAGQDLNEFQQLPATIRDALEQTYHPNIRAIRELEKPVIAAVNGPCAGAGLSLACACDVRIASSDATFVPGFIGIGLVPDAGGSWFVHRLLGFSRAFEWMVSNRRLRRGRGARRGASSPRPCMPSASRNAWRSSPSGTRRCRRRVSAMTKRLFEHAYTASLEEQLALEAELQQVATQTEDFGEGVQAFLDKRVPDFKGR